MFAVEGEGEDAPRENSDSPGGLSHPEHVDFSEMPRLEDPNSSDEHFPRGYVGHTERLAEKLNALDSFADPPGMVAQGGKPQSKDESKLRAAYLRFDEILNDEFITRFLTRFFNFFSRSILRYVVLINKPI